MNESVENLLSLGSVKLFLLNNRSSDLLKPNHRHSSCSEKNHLWSRSPTCTVPTSGV